MLLVHCDRRAASRAACTAGSNSATSTPMIAITTSSSTSVNPWRDLEVPGMTDTSVGICEPALNIYPHWKAPVTGDPLQLNHAKGQMDLGGVATRGPLITAHSKGPARTLLARS